MPRLKHLNAELVQRREPNAWRGAAAFLRRRPAVPFPVTCISAGKVRAMAFRATYPVAFWGPSSHLIRLAQSDRFNSACPKLRRP